MLPNATECPEHLQQSLLRYADPAVRCKTGDFLAAVLSNDLLDACCRADSINVKMLPAIVSFVHSQLRGDCKGSRTAVKEWLNRRDYITFMQDVDVFLAARTEHWDEPATHTINDWYFSKERTEGVSAEEAVAKWWSIEGCEAEVSNG